jgi:hypothetical protein
MRERPGLKRKQDAEILLTRSAVIDLLLAIHEKGADFRFRASGTSMYPVIHDGDIITLSPPKGIRPAPRDILAFRHPDTGKLIIHRVIAVSPDTFLARGDNSLSPDGVIPVSGIVGVVTGVERDGAALLWPDIRRFPRAARIYFRMLSGSLHLKSIAFSVYQGLIR